jgi:hypothetical protein
MGSKSNALIGSLVATCLAMTTVPAALRAQQGGAGAYQSGGSTGVLAQGVRTVRPPELDGRLEDPAWADAPAISGFVQHEPFEGRPATE